MTDRISEPYFRFGEGKISGWISVLLGALSVLGVLCFHFPDFLTTPQLRRLHRRPDAVSARRRHDLFGGVRARHLWVEPAQADGRDRHHADIARSMGRRR